MVEWFERAWLWCRESPEGREFKAGLCHPTTGKLCQPSGKWVFFSNQGRIRQQKERDGLGLSFAVTDTVELYSPHCNYGY